MRWPLVSRSRYEAEADAAVVAREAVKDRERKLAHLGHRIVEVKREHAKLLTDLRLVRVQIEYPSPVSDKIGFQFQMHGAVFDGFRGDRLFVELLAYMVEGQMRETPEGRETLAGLYTGRIR